MNLEQRINVMVELGKYLKGNDPDWQKTINDAYLKNQWFTPEFTRLAANNIADRFLQKDKLENWVRHYHLDDNIEQKNVGIVMAGNIPMVGFHDLLATFITGHKQTIKLSSKDDVLLKHIVQKLIEYNNSAADHFAFAETLKDLDAYITTGSNNTSRYFEYYFGRYPSIIRKNRTSVAVLDGSETLEDLEKLADDICNFFGLGCRNVTKIFVPENYDFVNFLNAFSKYQYFTDHKKYRNNFDYYLTLQIMNSQFYMTNNIILLLKKEDVFSPVSQVNYGFYKNKETLIDSLKQSEDIQCIVGKNEIPFGGSQMPELFNYADGVDTMAFLLSI